MACNGSARTRFWPPRTPPHLTHSVKAPAVLPRFGFVVCDRAGLQYSEGHKTAELDYRAGPMVSARGQRVAVVLGASSKRHGPGRHVIATGILDEQETYVVNSKEYRALAKRHKGKECGWAFRKGMRIWQLRGVRTLRQPARIRMIRGTRRWTECIPA